MSEKKLIRTPKDTVFISSTPDNEFSTALGVINNLFVAENLTIESSNFNMSFYINNYFNIDASKAISYIGLLNSTDSAIETGINISPCKKYKIKKISALNNNKLKDIYKTQFADVLTTWKGAYNTLGYESFYTVKNETINLTTIANNMTLGYDIAGDFLEDLYILGANNKSLNYFIPTSGSWIIKKLRSFYNYEILSNSNLYNSISMDPMFHFLVDHVNKIINMTEVPATFASLSVNEMVFANLYKFLYYDIEFRKNNSYESLPYIDFGKSISFELYRNSKLLLNGEIFSEYYVAIREDFSKYFLSVMKTEVEFSQFIQDILFIPSLSKEDRLFYCG